MTQFDKIRQDIIADLHFQKHFPYVLGRVEVALLAHQQDLTVSRRPEDLSPSQHFEEIGRLVDSMTKLGEVLRQLESPGRSRTKRALPKLHDQHFKGTPSPKQDKDDA